YRAPSRLAGVALEHAVARKAGHSRERRSQQYKAGDSRMNHSQRRNSTDCELAIPWKAHSVVSEAVPRALPGDTKRLRAWKVISDALTAIWAACGFFEYVALGYLAFSSALIAIFAENLAHPFRLLVTQALVASGILFLCRRTDISLAPASHSR